MEKRTIFDKINNLCAKYYSPTEHLAVDEIMLLIKDNHLQNIYTKETHIISEENLKSV
jgi:hypothetical protein